MERQQNGWRGRAVLFLVSQCVTLFGSTLVQMAIVWYVTKLTSSGAWVSAFTVCSYVPQFLLSFAGGVWADRYDRKKLIIAADAAIAAVTLALMLAFAYIGAGAPQLAALLIVSALRSLAAGVQTPAVNAALPQLVPQQALMRMNGVNATMQSVVQFAAPAAAGAVLTFSTLRASLLIDVATAAVGIGMLGCVALPKQAAQSAESERGENLLSDMRVGLRYTASQPFLWRLLLVYGLFIFLSVPAGFLATLFVSRSYGDSYWYLTAVELVGFGGMAAGGLAMSVWGGFRNTVTTLRAGLAAFGLLAAGMGASGSFLLYLILMAVYGIALTMVQTATTALVQSCCAPEMQGRVFGLMGSAYSGFLPLGMAVFGPLADLLALRAVMIGSGAALLVLAAVLCADRRFRV